MTPRTAASRLLASFGQNSYHIYLVQMLYFISIYRFLDLLVFSKLMPGDGRFLVAMFVHVPACLLLGRLFQRVESRVWDILGKGKRPDQRAA